MNCILEDKEGNYWFATHHNGVCRLNAHIQDGQDASFTHFSTREGVNGTEAWNLYEDKLGNIWFPTEGYGVYRYDSASGEFANYPKNQGLASDAIQCTFEDNEGRLWFGGYMGLFRYDLSDQKAVGKSVLSVTKNAPWQ